MFITRKISPDTVAVVNDFPVSIELRKSGKQYFNTEKPVVKIVGGKLIVDTKVAKEFGIEVQFITE